MLGELNRGGRIVVSKYYRAEVLFVEYCNLEESKITVTLSFIPPAEELRRAIINDIKKAFIAGYKAAYDDVKNGKTEIE